MTMSTTEMIEMTDAVRETAMLADVSISTWSGSRTDNNLLEGVKRQHNATGNVGKVIKNLLAGADEPLKATKSAYQAVRSKHYELTLPWVGDPHTMRQSGPRLLPNALFNTYMTEMSTLQRAAKAALEELLGLYPDLIARARQNLGSMADGGYPTTEELRASFRVSFDFEPIPEGAQFRGLSEDTLGKLTKRLEKKQEAQVAQATAAMWQEARKRIEHLVERLTTTGSSDEDAPRFKAATVESVRALITLLPGWNITGNPLAGEIAAELETLLLGVDAEELRKNPRARSQTAREARRVADKIRGWQM